MKTFISIFLIFLNIFCCSCSNKRTSIFNRKEILSFEFPIFLGAYDINRVQNQPPETKSISYKVKVDYKSKKVLDWYDKEFKKTGYKNYQTSSFGKREWEEFVDATRPENPLVIQLISIWVNQNETIMVIVLLRYIPENGEELPTEQFVLCQVQPFVEIKE